MYMEIHIRIHSHTHTLSISFVSLGSPNIGEILLTTRENVLTL